ncbi:MAG: hypothetical protein LCH95_10180 [Proteobacteria bacterium]|nr:hypothetical protein [Pseudomonadota bacterium]
MKAFAVVAAGLSLAIFPAVAQAQQAPAAPPAAKPAQTCQSQHVEAPGTSAASLIARGFDIKAAVVGGLWVQKDREVYFCNSGRAGDADNLCWRLREPVKGQPCP